jgi:hypothetical protein
MLIRNIKLSLPVLILLLVGCPLLVSAQGRDPVPERREVTREELDRRFDLARSLAKEGKFEQALNEYLFVFDNSREVSSYGGVRLSYVPIEIAEMGRVYRPAVVALKTRRDEREKLVLTGKAGFDVVQELTSLNQYLDEPERSVALFDKLKTMGTVSADVREDLLTLIWEQLVEAKRYSDLKDKVDELAKRVANQIGESAVNKDFPDNGALSSPAYQNYLRGSIIDDGGKVYETLLALGKTEKAEKLAKWMLTFSSDGEMYARLINSAINVTRIDIANDFLERAYKTLQRAEDLQLVRQAGNRVPKAN